MGFYNDLYQMDSYQLIQNPMPLELMVQTLQDQRGVSAEAERACVFAEDLLRDVNQWRTDIARRSAMLRPVFQALEVNYQFEHGNPDVFASYGLFAQLQDLGLEGEGIELVMNTVNEFAPLPEATEGDQTERVSEPTFTPDPTDPDPGTVDPEPQESQGPAPSPFAPLEPDGPPATNDDANQDQP